MHVALISDTHLSARAPECVANWHAAARAAASARPELTIHLGDITLDGQNQFDELPFASQLVRAWPTPMRCVPGNHDMGSGGDEERVDAAAIARCKSAFGTGRWCLTVRGWTLVGINAQLLGSGSREEAAQETWLKFVARRLSESDPLALFLHKPIRRPPRDRAMPSGRYVGAESARWLLEGPLRANLRLVVSGHTHQAFDFIADGVRHIWVPSSSFIISDELQRPVGRKVIGLGWLNFDAAGFEYAHAPPPGATRHELTNLAFYRELAHP